MYYLFRRQSKWQHLPGVCVAGGETTETVAGSAAGEDSGGGDELASAGVYKGHACSQLRRFQQKELTDPCRIPNTS